MILSEEKQVLVFNCKCKKEIGVWKELEEIKQLNYLGFVFNNAENYEDHLVELDMKGVIVAKKSWGLGDQRYEQDFKTRKCYIINQLKV